MQLQLQLLRFWLRQNDVRVCDELLGLLGLLELLELLKLLKLLKLLEHHAGLHFGFVKGLAGFIPIKAQVSPRAIEGHDEFDLVDSVHVLDGGFAGDSLVHPVEDFVEDKHIDVVAGRVAVWIKLPLVLFDAETKLRRDPRV